MCFFAIEAMPSHKALLAEYASKSRSIKDLLVGNPILLWGLFEHGVPSEITLGEMDKLTV